MAACDFVKFGAILFAVFTACTATDSIVMSVNEQLPNAGDTVVFSYTAYGLAAGSFIRLEKIFDDKAPVVIATNYILESPFDTIERYAIELNKNATVIDESKFVFTFTIKDIKEEDSGTFKAVAPEDEAISATAEVNVRRDPDVIQFFVGEPGAEVELTDGQTLEFEEEVSQSVRCVVSGSNPLATASILRGSSDITDKFESSSKQERTPTDVAGLEKISNTVTLQAENLLLDFSFASKVLKCSGKLAGSDTELTRSVTIKFKGMKPMIHCRDSQESYSGEPHVNITCHVMAAPPVEPENAHIYWHSSEGNNKPTDPTVSLNSTHSSWGHYSVEFTREGDEGTFMVIRFGRVFPQMFRTYYFVAKNDIGTTERAVMLTRDKSREVETSSSSVMTLSTLVIALTSLVALSAH